MSRAQLEVSNTMRRLWMEHVLWTRFFIVSSAFNLPDLQFVTERLLRNPHDFANELRSLYGQQIAMRFDNLFTSHLTIAAELVNAAKEGDSTEVEKQRELWYQNARDIAKFLGSINPFWSERTWREMLFEHLKMTEDEAVQILTDKYQESIKQYDSIQAQALSMADLMTYGLIRQFQI
ncbi:MAG TPA: acetylglutamate kinase [Clostridiales bacterium]|nr:acetylglutamate kinase [Clostridiales bacterium]